MISRNVAELVTLPTVRKRKRTAWTSEEARRFLESARDARDAMYAGYVLAVVLGLRKGEILGLTWDALDFDNGELAVSHQLQRASGELLHPETKTAASDDTVPLPSIVVAALEKRRREQRADQKEAELAWHPNDLVFTTKYGLPIDPPNFNRSWDNRVTLRGSEDHRARWTAILRHAAGRPGRAPPGDHAHPAARAVLDDDGDLLAGVLEEDAGRAQTSWREPRRVAPLLYFAAIKATKEAVHSTVDGL
ncbi:tyrosine-type recombinase/integrase [Amycolatopsis sp. NPDC047767]|uniref:tyrosine-type recombinase/integrase n=1 Tax=Amycolatopsis sp. NPDC047767 TaxID=3156765 RepID=UPI0034526510